MKKDEAAAAVTRGRGGDAEEIEEFSVVDGELVEDSESANQNLSKTEDQSPKTEIANKAQSSKLKAQIANDKGQRTKDQELNRQSAIRNYLLLPLIFLSVTLLGGLRLSSDTNAFIFLKPALVCLVFAATLLVLFFRTELLKLEGWFSENFTTLKNTANAFVIFTLFTASVQIFNALLPERGLPFWIIGLLFFWTLWNNLFSVFTAKRLVQSLGGLFGLAFVLKYLVLANLAAPASENWLRSIIENPTKEAFTYLLDLPKFSGGTGYIQFFTVIFYVLGLFLLSPVSTKREENGTRINTDSAD